MQAEVVRIGPEGGILVSAPLLRAARLEAGDQVLVVPDPRGGLRLLTPVQRAQELVARYVRRGRSLSRELLNDRRRNP